MTPGGAPASCCSYRVGRRLVTQLRCAEVCSGLSPGSAWQTLDLRALSLIGNKIKGTKRAHGAAVFAFTSGPFSTTWTRSALCKIQQVRGAGRREREQAKPDAHQIQSLNFSGFVFCFFFFLPKFVAICSESAPTYRAEFQDHLVTKQYFLCHFPASHTLGRMKWSQDETHAPVNHRGTECTIITFPFNKQYGILFQIFKKLINSMSGAEKRKAQDEASHDKCLLDLRGILRLTMRWFLLSQISSFT